MAEGELGFLGLSPFMALAGLTHIVWDLSSLPHDFSIRMASHPLGPISPYRLSPVG